MSESKGLVLPVSVIGPTDVARLLREIKRLDDFFQQSEMRGSAQSSQMPRASRLLEKLAQDNGKNMLRQEDRQAIIEGLEIFRTHAPVLHISFSVDPPGAYVQKIVEWLRGNVHDHVLVTIGLQPNIGAGCVVRTQNKIFDFSLREYFNSKRMSFTEHLHRVVSDKSDDALYADTGEQYTESEDQSLVGMSNVEGDQ